METQLENLAASYDQAIELGRQGIDLYGELPPHITSHPGYEAFEKSRDEGSGSPHIRAYLAPKPGMRFVDLGCCLNLMFNGYAQWPSTYYGVDISPKTIALLKEYAAKNNLSTGALYCGSMHQTPFDSDFFDLGACIGSLEYFKKDFVEKVLIELHRVMKPGGKLVLDIPNAQSPAGQVMLLVEAYLGRPDLFDLSLREFEALLKNYFTVDSVCPGAMLVYYLSCKK